MNTPWIIKINEIVERDSFGRCVKESLPHFHGFCVGLCVIVVERCDLLINALKTKRGNKLLYWFESTKVLTLSVEQRFALVPVIAAASSNLGVKHMA